MVDNTDMPWQGELDEDIVTVGDRMREAGYYSAYKGKFHMLNEGTVLIPGSTGGEENLQQQDALERYGFSDWNPEGDITGSMLEGYHSDGYIKSEAVRWLRDKGSTLNKSGRPFFLAVNFINPHDIMFYNPTGQKTALDTNAAPENAIYEQTYGYAPSTWDHASWGEGGIPAHREYHDLWSAAIGNLPQERAVVEKFNDYYLNCIQDQDNELMDLLGELKLLGMMDNTIIIFTSDHGEMAGAHGLKGKANLLYEENLHVPFIIYHPAYEGNRRISALTSHLDIVPTIMDMAGVAERGDLTGHSLLPLLSGQVDSIRDGALFATGMVSILDSGYGPLSGRTDLDMTKRGLMRAIITERYKFARYFSPLNFNTPETLDDLYAHNDVELYDLESDPKELHNLGSNRETNAALIENMNRQLNALIAAEIGVDDGAEMEATLAYFEPKPAKAGGSGGCNVGARALALVAVLWGMLRKRWRKCVGYAEER
jgi:arylsulfatase